MNRYEKELNKRLEQESTWSSLMSSLLGGLLITIWVVFLFALNVAFLMIAVWLLQRVIGA